MIGADIPPAPCDEAQGTSFVCGAHHPEDLALIPGTHWLVASGFNAGSGIKLVDTRARTLRRWYTGEATQIERSPGDVPVAGVPACTSPPDAGAFNAQGMSLRQLGDSTSLLYVSNHGGREAIEVFRIQTAAASEPTLRWIGCVPMPEGMAANSVAALPDGGVLVTVLNRPGTQIADYVQGRVTGLVYEWNPGTPAFEQVRGAELPGNNGIEVSRDGQEFYVVAFGWRAVVAFSHSNPTRILRKAVAPGFMPDNIHWDGDRLIAAGMQYDEPACGGLRKIIDGRADPMLCHRGYTVARLDIPTHYYGKHPHQEVNLHADAAQFEIYRPFVKRAWRVDRPDLFPEILDKAFHLAESGRPGPVLISVPMDIFSAKVDTSLFERLRHNARTFQPPSLDEGTAERIVTSLAASRAPVLYVGGGVLIARAAAELRSFVDHMGIPVAHSLMGKGALPDDHPLTLGMTGFWGTKFINEKCRTADRILALGTRFCEADCSSWEREFTFSIPPTKLIHIDIDPAEIGRNFPVELGAVADLKMALQVLNRAARRLFPAVRRNAALEREIAENREEFQRSNRAAQVSTQVPMRPERILAVVREVLPRDAIFTTDVGWNKNGVGQQFPVYEPGSVLTPGGYATMGFGAPAAIGAKIGCPTRTVVSLVGDGGFGQNPALLATAFEQGTAVIWIIMNNFAFGTIAGLQKAHFGTTLGTVFHKDGKPYSPDFAAIARAYGIDGVRVESPEDFKPALQKALALGKPYVLDVIMENAPVPTAGHWNIMDIYSPGQRKTHVAT